MRQHNESAGSPGQRRWTSRSIASRFQHRFFYFLIRLGGRRAAYGFLYVVVFYYTLFSRKAKQRAGYYLARRFNRNGFFSNWLDTYRLMREFGKLLIDRAILGILGTDKIDARFDDEDRLVEVIDQGRGVILMFSHVGCWQVAMSAMGILNKPVNMLLHHEEGDVDRHYFEHRSAQTPYHVIDPRGYLGGVLEMMDVLKKGEILCVMGDRVMGSDKNVVSVDFLGKNAYFPYSAFKIASDTGAPVVVLFSHKTGPAAYELNLADVIHVPEKLGRSADHYIPHVTRFVKALESFTREHPYHFFNFYDMWG